ncbi:MAG TPA: EAL domain-containing protein [Pyrinomonadaceae bacterium]|nr:EAL domain-containing protein [Pyrinomonadaceae bacterium]
MHTSSEQNFRQKLTFPFQWLVIVTGLLISVYYAIHLPLQIIDLRFLLLASLTLIISSRVAIKVPRFGSNITISDTFIFLAILLYGGEAGILLSAAEGLSSGARVGRKARTILFNSSVMACSAYATVQAVSLFFGSTSGLTEQSFPMAVTALSVMALVQYFTNTGMVALAMSFKYGHTFWDMWSKNYLWASITYFAGAGVAGFIASSVGMIGIYAILVSIPMVSILYFTYYNYLEDIRSTAAKAEQATRERAEAERERAEQAERHVEELNKHLAEQERISRELEESREHFRYVAFHDTLTNLPNRALLNNHLQGSIDKAKTEDSHLFALLFLDLDRFKNINDSLGHMIGDELLISTARRLEECLRPSDMVARLGGDEFAILLDGVEEYADVIRVAERVQNELKRPLNLNGHEVYTTASMGITLSTNGYDHPENILRDADTAMYHAKEKGKARYEIFNSTMHARAVARLQLENDLRRALERHELVVYYQPIISLENDRISGFEALVRWHHPQRGFISPADFIPVAEETGLIVELGRWVLEESCRRMRAWHLLYSNEKPMTISVNLSGRQFTQSNLIEQIQLILKETGLDPRFLKLEITESVVMENAEVASSMLQQLRALGVKLSIDDFGTGYSSLSYLHRFPVNTLKIDRSFISRLGAGDENTEIVRTIITLAKNLGMDVVAEGVETEKHLSILKEMRCQFAQGYLFSKAVDGESASRLLEDERAQAGVITYTKAEQEELGLLGSALVM